MSLVKRSLSTRSIVRIIVQEAVLVVVILGTAGAAGAAATAVVVGSISSSKNTAGGSFEFPQALSFDRPAASPAPKQLSSPSMALGAVGPLSLYYSVQPVLRP